MRTCLLSATCAALAAHSCALAQESPASRLGPVREWETNSFELERSSNTMTFDTLRIFGDNWSLSAEAARATATQLEFEAGEWHFEGDVRVVLDTAVLEADTAVFTFRNKRLASAEFRGAPVTFEDLAGTAESPVHGTAEILTYDGDGAAFELRGSVSLTVGPYRTTGCDLVYYLGQEEFTTGSTRCEERFRTVIVPQETTETTAE